jgi:deazaflavin-dependent oxidoreductase (nitroreductase family)
LKECTPLDVSRAHAVGPLANDYGNGISAMDLYIVVASKAGATTNPDWYHNLVANPAASVALGNKSFDVLARVTDGDERERLFDKVAARFPIYRDYQSRTSRLFPVIVLKGIE